MSASSMSKVKCLLILLTNNKLYSQVHSPSILFWISFVIQKVIEYDQELPQSHTTGRPMAPRGRVKERMITATWYSEHKKVKQPALYSPAR